MPEYNIIPVKIDTFNYEYFLLGFSDIPSSELDLSKSIFNNGEKNFTFNSFEEYNDTNYSKKKPIELYLNKKYDFDIINIQIVYGMYFSEKLVETLEENKIIGFRTTKEIILMN